MISELELNSAVDKQKTILFIELVSLVNEQIPHTKFSASLIYIYMEANYIYTRREVGQPFIRVAMANKNDTNEVANAIIELIKSKNSIAAIIVNEDIDRTTSEYLHYRKYFTSKYCYNENEKILVELMDPHQRTNYASDIIDDLIKLERQVSLLDQHIMV